MIAISSQRGEKKKIEIHRSSVWMTLKNNLMEMQNISIGQVHRNSISNSKERIRGGRGVDLQNWGGGWMGRNSGSSQASVRLSGHVVQRQALNKACVVWRQWGGALLSLVQGLAAWRKERRALPSPAQGPHSLEEGTGPCWTWHNHGGLALRRQGGLGWQAFSEFIWRGGLQPPSPPRCNAPERRQ